MVQQLMGDGKNPVKYESINIPGRTPRALKEHYALLKNEVNSTDLKSQGPPGAPAVRAAHTPAKQTNNGNQWSSSSLKVVSNIVAGTGIKATTPASKRKAKGDGENGNTETTPTAKKRKSPVKKKLVKNEPDEEEVDDTEMPALHDTSGDENLARSPESYHSYDFYE